MSRSLSQRLSLVLLLAAALLPAAARAHPHAWIDLVVTVRFDDSRRAVALEQEWRFDPLYTVVALQDLGTEAGAANAPERLQAFAAKAIANLREYDYFTRVRSGGAAVDIATVTEFSGSLDGNRLLMTFVTPFSGPVALKEPMRYAVYDPTYYIEMLHADASGAIRLSTAPPDCVFRLEKPEPDQEIVARAYMLDRTESAGDTLGQHFAEWVTVQCGQGS